MDYLFITPCCKFFFFSSIIRGFFLTKQWQEEKIVIFPVDIYRLLNESLVTDLFSAAAWNSFPLQSSCAPYLNRRTFPMIWQQLCNRNRDTSESLEYLLHCWQNTRQWMYTHTQIHVPALEILWHFFIGNPQTVAFFTVFSCNSLSSSEWNFPVLLNVEIMNFGISKSAESKLQIRGPVA